MSCTSILAIGMVLVIVCAEIDLSVGAMTGFLGALSAILFVNHSWPLWSVFLATIGAGALLGHIQGHIVTWFKMPSFIVTLGGMLIYQGSLLGVTGGVAISPTPDYLFVGQAFLSRALGWALVEILAVLLCARGLKTQTNRWKYLAMAVLILGFAIYEIDLLDLIKNQLFPIRYLAWFLVGTAFLFIFYQAIRAGNGFWKYPSLAALALGVTGVLSAYDGVPVPVLIMLVLAAVFSIVASQTPFGRHLYAIGGNREAAFYSGINIQRHLILVFTLMGALCGVAGIVLTARVGAATSDAGRMMELDAIAATVIGGTSLMGGRGTVWGALLGALMMASIDNGMSLMNTESFWQPIIKGSILITAVGLDMMGRKGKT
jgi:D-xylose transport system permease protein